MRIAFLTRNTRTFTGASLLNELLDGIQGAMVELARALVARGHEAAIFCNCQEPGVYDGVSYRPIVELARFSRQQALDLFVCVAGDQDLKIGIPARVTLWWSDNEYGLLTDDEAPDLRAEIGGLLATRADRLVAVSAAQAERLAGLFKLPLAHFWSRPHDIPWPELAAEWEACFGEGFVSTRQARAPEVAPFPTPKISVIIPTYNRARNLRHCLESLTWQDEKAFEVIVWDDGSSDDTREVALSFKGRLNLRYRWQEHLGFRAGEARNHGVEISRAKLLLFLDSDLVVPPDFLRSHAEAHARWRKQKVVVNSFVWRMLEDRPDDIGLPPAEYIPRHKDILKPDNRIRFNAFERSDPLEETYLLDSNAFSVWREDFELFGGFDTAFVGWGHEDTELGYRVASHGYRLGMIRAEAYHLYHYIPKEQDDERAVNWKRLTTKHGITRWYRPLPSIEIDVPVLCFDNLGALAVLQPAEWVLKSGFRLPMGGIYARLVVEDGVLVALEDIVPPDPAAGR